MKMDVYEYFIWNPYVVSLEVENEDFSDFFVIPREFRRAIRELYRSVRIIKFKPRLQPQREKHSIFPKELLRSLRIVDYHPFIRKRSVLGETPITKAVLKRLLGILEVTYNFKIEGFKPIKIAPISKEQCIRAETNAYRQILYSKAENDLCASARICNYVPFVDGRHREPISDYFVQPTKEALEGALSGCFKAKTYPWKVLSVHEEHLVVEVVSKTGTTYPVTFHKSFMEKVEPLPVMTVMGK